MNTVLFVNATIMNTVLFVNATIGFAENLFLVVLFAKLLIKTQHLHIIWKIEAVFQFFYRSIFDATFCYLME